jgi:hypothetical protein
MQADLKAKVQTLPATLSPSQAFHRTPYGRAQEFITRVQRELEKLKPLIWWLKNKTGTSTKSKQENHNQKIDITR